MNYLYDGVSLQNGRSSNMDSLLLREHVIGGLKAMIAVVCDGVGATEDGALAASLAVRMLSEWFGGQNTVKRLGLRMRDAVLAINARIIEMAKIYSIDTASTLSALLLLEDMYYIVHTGDSRIYCYYNSILSQLTKDDISETGKLTSCIGQKKNIIMFYREGEIGGKTFLLCSDGLYKRIDLQSELAKMDISTKKGLRKTIACLTQYVIEQDEHDNISLALVKTQEG